MMGNHKYIETPEKMWELFLEYWKEVKSDPFEVVDWVGGMAKEVVRKKEKPLTNEGFSLYLFQKGIIADVKDYFSNRDGRYEDYVPICSRITEAIRHDQITGGMAGMYNPSITQRLNGLVEKSSSDDKKEITVKVKYERRADGEAERIAQEPSKSILGEEEV